MTGALSVSLLWSGNWMSWIDSTWSCLVSTTPRHCLGAWEWAANAKKKKRRTFERGGQWAIVCVCVCTSTHIWYRKKGKKKSRVFFFEETKIKRQILSTFIFRENRESEKERDYHAKKTKKNLQNWKIILFRKREKSESWKRRNCARREKQENNTPWKCA